jgi:ABC-type branched-subunit amino acid transport system permease subunit
VAANRTPDLPEALTPVRVRTIAAAAASITVVVAWAVGDHLLPRGLPVGVVASGVVYGALDALLACAIVLVYRASRAVNFAQAEFGAVAAVLALEFIFQWHLNYVVAIATGLVIAAATGVIVELSVIRRLRFAPRLIVAVATIGLAQILDGFAVLIPIQWSGRAANNLVTPFGGHLHFRLFPYVFNGDYVAAVVASAGALLALTIFLRRSAYGVAIRASAENRDRAQLLGVPVGRLSTVVWAIAAVLSTLTVILRVPLIGFASFESVSGAGPALLLRTFAAAVLGGMENLPRTAAAAIGLGVAAELGAWSFSNSTYVDALLLGVILAALLTQRERFTRAAETGIGTYRSLREVRPVPSELRHLPEVRWFRAGLVALGVLVAIGLPVVLAPSQEQLAGLVLIYAMVAVSLVVLTGWSGNISLGQFAFVGFGAAATGTLVSRHGWDFFTALPVACAVAAAVALIVGLPALRVRGPFLAVTTLAFAVTSSTFFLAPRFFPWFVTEHVERPVLWGRLPIDADWQMYYVCLAGFVLVTAAAHGVRRSRAGRALVASRDNPMATQSFAISTTRLHLTAFALSGAMAGLAGGLYVLHQRGLHTASFGPDVSLRLFSMVVIGGLGSLPGAILGAVYIRGAEFFLSSGWSQLASGFGIVALLVVSPGGLGELLYRARDDLLRRVAYRRSVHVPSLVADVRVPEREEAGVGA